MTKVAAIQMNSGDDVESNLQVTRELIREAKTKDAEVAILPECFALMANSHSQRLLCAEREHRTGYIERNVAKLAAKEKIWIIAAGIFTRGRDPTKIRNTSYLFNSAGERIDRYEKINLFDVTLDNGEYYGESSFTEPGSQFVVSQTPIGNLGLTVCYDVRFPTLFRILASKGAVVYAVPSAFAYTTGKDHWELLLRARAVENHAYVIAPAQWGSHTNQRKTYGHTMVVDPWGNVLRVKSEGNGVVVGEINLEYAKEIRNRFASN